jgi:ADP-glucose pyrophosphorylase
MQSGVDRRITGFIEKPSDESGVQEMKMSRELLRDIGANEDDELFQASMGIYVFNREVLIKSLESDLFDFGKHIIPTSIKIGTSARLFSKVTGKTSEQSAHSTRLTSI